MVEVGARARFARVAPTLEVGGHRHTGCPRPPTSRVGATRVGEARCGLTEHYLVARSVIDERRIIV